LIYCEVDENGEWLLWRQADDQTLAYLSDVNSKSGSRDEFINEGG